jgi:hypothetical protein
MKIHEHPNLRHQWPPVPQSSAPETNTLVAENHDIVEAVYFYPGGGRWRPNVTLKTSYAGRIYARDIFLENREFAESIAWLFKKHIGQTVAELSNLEIAC